MLGVLGGLIFVGLEMQQSQRIAIAGQIQARNQMLLDIQLAFLGEEPIGRSILSQGNPITFNPESLSEEEFAVWYQIMQSPFKTNVSSINWTYCRTMFGRKLQSES